MRQGLGRVVLAVAGTALLGGCYPREIAQGNPLGFLMKILTGNIGYVRAKTLQTMEGTVDVDISCLVGGLSNPTYTLTLDDPAGGTFGTFTGTAEIKKGRFVSLKDSASPELLSTVTNLVEKALGGDTVSLTKVKAKVKAYQTPGGVEAVWSFSVSFSGGITSGPNAGNPIKGKFTGEGQDPPVQ